MVVIDWVACGGWRCCTSLLYSGSWRSRGPWPGDLATGLARRVEALTPCQPDVTSSGPDYWRNWVAYPTQDDVMQADPLLEWIDTEFLRPDPFAFACKGFKSIVSLITREFKVDPNGVYCIGSGAIGLSMNPVKIMEKGLKPFGADSDLDLAFISEVHFERAWRDLREASQPTLAEISDTVLDNLNWQRKRFFDGAIIANKLLSDLSFGEKWLTAQMKVEQEVSILLDRNISINYWIYRDYWSLRNYVASSIMQCRRKLV